MQFFNNDKASERIIRYFYGFIQNEVTKNNKENIYFDYLTDVNYKKQITTLLNFKDLTIGVALYQERNTIGGFVWKKKEQTVLYFNEIPRISECLKNLKKLNVVVDEVQLVVIVQNIILILSSPQVTLENYRSRMGKPSDLAEPNLLKWVLIKQYKINKLQNESGNLLDNVDLSSFHLNKSPKGQQQQQQSHVSKTSDEFRHLFDQNQSSRFSKMTKILPSDIISHSHRTQPSQINKQEFNSFLEQLKNEVLDERPSKSDGRFLSHRQELYGGRRINDVISFRLEDLESMLRDYVKNQPQEYDKGPVNDLQELMHYYYQNNPEQYKILLNQYQDVIHKQLFDKMGLGGFGEAQQQTKQRRLSQRSNMSLPNSQFNLPLVHQSRIQQSTLQPNPSVVDIIASRYNRQITRNEFETFKTKFTMSSNLLDFYLKVLDELTPRILIMSLKFYDQLSAGNYETTKHFTGVYYGRDNTIFDLFDRMLIPVRVHELEYIGVVFDFQNKSITYINTLERANRHIPAFKDMIDNPIVQKLIDYIKLEFNNKVMRNFDILSWRFVQFDNGYAQQFNHSAVILAYVFDSFCRNKQISADNNQLKQFMESVLKTIRSVGITKNKKNELNKLKWSSIL